MTVWEKTNTINIRYIIKSLILIEKTQDTDVTAHEVYPL